MKPEQGQVSYGLPIHFLMAFCGGFFGSYAVFNRMSVFGNAQTANLIELIGAVLGHDFPDALLLSCLSLWNGSFTGRQNT